MVPPRDEPPSDSRPPEEFAETHVVSHKANASTCRRSGAPSIGLDQAASYSSAEAAVMVHSFSRMAAVAWDWRLRVHLTLQGKQRGGVCPLARSLHPRRQPHWAAFERGFEVRLAGPGSGGYGSCVSQSSRQTGFVCFGLGTRGSRRLSARPGRNLGSALRL